MFLWSCRQNKPTIDRSSTPGELKSPAMIRAEEVQSNLESAFPSFVKSLVRSHVGSCFWMVGLLNAWTWARLMTLSKEAPVDIYFDICFFFFYCYVYDRGFLDHSVEHTCHERTQLSPWKMNVGKDSGWSTSHIRQDWVLVGGSFVLHINCLREMCWSFN